MNKQVKLKVKETAATNSDFYNLFRPIAPSIDVIGKVAQVISGVTEAITIWYITQSEMAGASKFVSIAVSIFAMILVVALLELGGRKFLQVLTRALVWNRLKNAWYIGLFAIVSLITVGMGVLSFRMSTNGINHAFVSNVPVGKTFDDLALKKEYRESIKEISARLDSDLKVIKENHQGMISNTSAQFDTRINAAQLKAKEYDAKLAQGFKWARSQGDKYRKKAMDLEAAKANAIMDFQKGYTDQLDQWQKKKNKSIDAEKATLAASILKGETAMNKAHTAKFKNATFWGGLFSGFVGFSVLLAFVCIISVEVYRRGSGIQVEYQEEEKDLPILTIFWKGLTGRMDNFFRTKVENFARVSAPRVDSPRIGFNFSTDSNVNDRRTVMNESQEEIGG